MKTPATDKPHIKVGQGGYYIYRPDGVLGGFGYTLEVAFARYKEYNP
jgi:hypothetical protein